MVGKHPIETVKSWAHHDIGLCSDVDASALESHFHSLNKTHTVYIIDLHNGDAELRPKDHEFPLLRARADTYLRHIRKSIRSYKLSPTTSLAIDVGDLAPEYPECPVFSFQRVIGSRNPLLPDIDTLTTDFYAPPGWALPDKIAYRAKSDIAIFAGSTTGVERIDAHHLEHPFPRLRAARYFRGNPRVDFRLTAIVQTNDAAVESALRAEGFGCGQLPWEEQMRCKLLLSMDGNGAALSRPYVALASCAALVKYASIYEAFYFRELVPGEHYLHVESDIDVLALVEGDMNRHEPIAYAGQEFVERYLSPAMYEAYTAELIDKYAAKYQLPAFVVGKKTRASVLVAPPAGVQYTNFLAELCVQREVRHYLEIGVQAGINMASIVVDHAIAVDPAFSLSCDPSVGKKTLCMHRMTSDAFFAQHSPSDIDMAFLDGMHMFEYLLRDFYNTESCCKGSGLITIHDCLPFHASMVTRVNNMGAWTGDIWKIVPALERYRPDLRIVMVDCHPTGLVCVTNLDPSSRVLKDNYLEIVREFLAAPNDLEALERFYADREVVPAEDILSNYNQSSYFKV